MSRKLAAILATDVVGYSRLMGVDEAGTLAELKRHRRELIDPKIADHFGRIVKTTGDGMLIEFPSVVEAVACAVEVQQRMAERNASVGTEQRIEFRMGINLGDVIADGDDVYGDGVNIAARLEQAAQPNMVLVSEDVYRQVNGKLAVPFDDQGPLSLKNIARPVRAYAARLAGPAWIPPLPSRDKPSVAVLPFDNLTGDASQNYLADGMVEEIIAALSRVKSFFVIARNSTFTYKGRAVRVDQVGRELGVRYVIEGSIQKSGNRVRLTAQLIEAELGRHVWSGRFDGNIEDIFDLQDRVTEQVVGALEPSIRSAEIERARRKRPDNLSAYDYTMRALPHVWALERADNRKALELLAPAIVHDPQYPLALALAAWCHLQQITYHWSGDWQKSRSEALKLARQATSLSEDDPMVLVALGAAQTLARNVDEAARLIERALTLDPNLSWGWNRSGWLHTYQEQPDLALAAFDKAVRLSPLDPMNFNCYHGVGAAHFCAGRYEECINWVKKGLAERPGTIWAHRPLVAAYAQLDRMDDARRELALLLRENPTLTTSAIADAVPWGPEMMSRYTSAFRKAGLPA
jgi:adenylate cyclase